MANYDLQVVLKSSSGLPEDVFINTLHYEVNAPDTVEGTCDDIAAAYLAVDQIIDSLVNGMTIKVYEPGANPGGPTFTKDYVFAGSGSNGPTEVAICLSYATVDDPNASTPRRRGRIYVGPIGPAGTNGNRVTPGIRANVLALGQGLASAGNASNTTWLMYSESDGVYTKIESIWVDDAYDTQRRRGLAPTLRDTQDVQ